MNGVLAQPHLTVNPLATQCKVRIDNVGGCQNRASVSWPVG